MHPDDKTHLKHFWKTRHFRILNFSVELNKFQQQINPGNAEDIIESYHIFFLKWD